ncbi:MAG: hypothetical protein WBL63_08425 [Candidatus Acidiferrum sp.]
MRYKRAHVLLPEDLAREIDAVAGRRGRSAFLVETAREALRRRKLLAFLQDDKAVWKDSDHPELREGSAKWVRRLRKESDRNRAPSRKRRTK